MTDRIDVDAARGRLAYLWLAGAGMVGVFLLAQTVTGKYGGQVGRAWGWFLPTVMPTLTVILTAWFAESDRSAGTVRANVFKVAFGLSAVYLLLVGATLFLQPLSGMTPLEFITTSNLWLGPFQGLVGFGIGRFFTSKPTG